MAKLPASEFVTFPPMVPDETSGSTNGDLKVSSPVDRLVIEPVPLYVIAELSVLSCSAALPPAVAVLP